MLSFARDLPNACSLAGLFAAVLGLYFAIRSVYPAALMALLWATVFDWSDGLIARRMKGRTADQRAFGAQLDSLIDIVSFSVAVAPAGIVNRAVASLSVTCLRLWCLTCVMTARSVSVP